MKGGVKAKHVAFGGMGVIVVVGIVLIILWQTGVIFKKSSPAAPGSPAAPRSLIGPGGQMRPAGTLGPGGQLRPGGSARLGPGGTEVCDFSLENPSSFPNSALNRTIEIDFWIRSGPGCSIPAGTQYSIYGMDINAPSGTPLNNVTITSSPDPNIKVASALVTPPPNFQGSTNAQVIMSFPNMNMNPVATNQFTINTQ